MKWQEVVIASVGALGYYTSRDTRKIFNFMILKMFYVCHSPFKRAKTSFAPLFPRIQLARHKVCHYPLYFIRNNMPLNVGHAIILGIIKKEKYTK